MDSYALILQPLILISGVGLLILSTTARFGQLEAQLHGIAADPEAETAILVRHLVHRGVQFRNALVSLYGSIALLTLASLAGAVLQADHAVALPVVTILTCIAFAGVLFAAGTLIAESLGSIEVFRHKADQLTLENS